jgi:5-methylcytosine-specific restriction enzyme subunit McrC
MLMTKRRRLTLEEHSTLRGVDLDAKDAEALRAGGARIALRPRPDGRYDVEAKQMVGTIRTTTIDLLIRPKVELEGFLDVLGHAPGLARLAGQLDLRRWDDLLPAITNLFARSLRDALRRGVLRGYRHQREALSFCRGRIDGLHLATRRFGVIPPIDCDFDEFSPDIEVNQRLKAAAAFLLRSGFGANAVRGQLRTALDQLADVTARLFRPPLAALPLDRRLAIYGPAVDLANLVLASASLDLHHGSVASVGFLVNMDDLYEAWVASVLREALGASTGRWRRHPPKLHLDHDRAVKLEPDVLWSPTGRPRIPIDAKYKRGTRIPNPDVYQMAAYCAGLQVVQGVVFCVDVVPHVLRLRNGVTVHVRRLSVEGASEARQRAIAREAEFLRSLTRVSSATRAPA